jgi:hypothetical protein
MGMIDAPTSMERLVPGTDLWLSMQYSTDNTTYFGFGTSKWNDTKKEIINTTGWCNPEPWTKTDMQCGVASADYFRVSEMRCTRDLANSTGIVQEHVLCVFLLDSWLNSKLQLQQSKQCICEWLKCY